MADLPEWGYELGDFQFGRETPFHVKSFDIGDAELDTGESSRPRADGERFGRDYYRGRTIIITGDIYTKRSNPGDPYAGYASFGIMKTAWSPDHIRLTPGAVMPLRMKRNGRLSRVYGRPRRCTPTTGSGSRGWVPYVAEFKCADHLFYSDAEYTETIPLIPVSIGGLIGPLIGDIIASPPGFGTGTVDILGDKPSWVGFKINGPIVDPIVEVTDNWFIEMKTTIGVGQFIIVDPVPWTRTVRRQDGANMSGVFTARSSILSEMLLPPGKNQVLLRGNDPTGTSNVELFWRDTYSLF